MIARWMLYAFGITTLLAVAGVLVERIAMVLRLPRRAGWALALCSAIVCTAAAPWRNQSPAINTITVSAHDTPARVDDFSAVADTPAGDSWVTKLLDRGRIALSDLVVRLKPVEPLLRAGWLLGAILLVLTYTFGVVVLARRRRSWVPRRVDGVDVLVAHRDGPAVLGLLHPRIVLPEWALALDPASRALMIRHECEHLHARDPLLLHSASLALILMPWNAAAWWIVYRLRLAIELDCDARVLRGSVRGDDALPADVPRYGQLLLDVATHRSPGNIRIAPALLEHTSSLSRRIAAMYPDRLRFPRMQSALAAISTIGLLVLTAQMPVPRLSAQEPSIERLVGSATAAPAPNLSVTATRALLQKYYPDVLRGEGPRSVAFIRDLSGRVIGAMSARDVEMLVGEMRGRDAIRDEPAREVAVSVGRETPMLTERRVEEASRTAVTAELDRGHAVVRESSITEVVDVLRERLAGARRVAEAEPSADHEAQVRMVESQLRTEEARLERFRRGSREGVGYEIPTGCGGASAEARACRERSQREQDSARVREEVSRERRQVDEQLRARTVERQAVAEDRDLQRAEVVLRDRIQQFDTVRAERLSLDPERAVRINAAPQYRTLMAQTVAIDVVRHASGLFGREPVNIFYVTRNGPN